MRTPLLINNVCLVSLCLRLGIVRSNEALSAISCLCWDFHLLHILTGYHLPIPLEWDEFLTVGHWDSDSEWLHSRLGFKSKILEWVPWVQREETNWGSWELQWALADIHKDFHGDLGSRLC